MDRSHLQIGTPSERAQSQSGNTAGQEREKTSFLSLPRELRDIIYDLYLSQRVDLTPRGPTARGAGLLLTCKQIYHEAQKPYYQSSIFWSKQLLPITAWLIQLRTHIRKWLRDIRWEHGEVEHSRMGSAIDFGSFSHGVESVRRVCGRDVTPGVLKTFLISRMGGHVWYSDEMAQEGVSSNESLDAFLRFAAQYEWFGGRQERRSKSSIWTWTA